MKKQNLQLYSLAQEWATLRQAAAMEEDPDKCMPIVERLTALVKEAEQLAGFNNEGSTRGSGSGATQNCTSDEKSGASD